MSLPPDIQKAKPITVPEHTGNHILLNAKPKSITNCKSVTLHLQGTTSCRSKCFENRHCSHGNAISSSSLTLGLQQQHPEFKNEPVNYPKKRKRTEKSREKEVKHWPKQKTWNLPLRCSAI